ncbi:MAG: alpha/beta hydrolase [Patescibacteria group bacterium]|jgi:hypothetical protein
MAEKRAYIVHGWGGSPQDAWIPWLKKTLESKGILVSAPQMPDEEHPRIDLWVGFLDGMVIEPDENTFFIGHSIGCQTIMRYIQILPEGVKIGAALFVAGWFNLEHLSSADEERIARPWLTQPIHDEKFQSHVKKTAAVISENDPFGCSKENIERFKKLGTKITTIKNGGHLDSQKELPELLTIFTEMGIII